MHCWTKEEYKEAEASHGRVLRAIEENRRLARYDEAIRLLREVTLYTDSAEMDNKIIAFLSAEPAERGEGGVG